VAGVAALASTVLPSSAHAEPGNGNGWGQGIGGGRFKGGGASCILKGTQVLTAQGEVAVEDLRIGDLVETVRGEALPIRWIGRQTFWKSGPSWPKSVMPVRVLRSALGDGTPHRDLYISPRHALFVDGFSVTARDLVNGLSINPGLPPGRERLEYFHILLDNHEIILTEGAPSGTMLIQTGHEHEVFVNFAEYERLYPGESRKAMARAAPHYGGWAHLAGLLRLGVSSVVDVRDPMQKAYARIAARAQAPVS